MFIIIISVMLIYSNKIYFYFIKKCIFMVLVLGLIYYNNPDLHA